MLYFFILVNRYAVVVIIIINILSHSWIGNFSFFKKFIIIFLVNLVAGRASIITEHCWVIALVLLGASSENHWILDRMEVAFCVLESMFLLLGLLREGCGSALMLGLSPHSQFLEGSLSFLELGGGQGMGLL